MSAASSAFTVACVPTGMKTGVGTSPWSVCKIPARARESLLVCVRVKFLLMTPYHGQKNARGQAGARRA